MDVMMALMKMYEYPIYYNSSYLKRVRSSIMTFKEFQGINLQQILSYCVRKHFKNDFTYLKNWMSI